MRSAFFETLIRLAERDERIMLLTGDLGFGVIEPFARRFPDRFLNAGVAEQNMTGVATGLALSGRIVFTYSIANFSTLRCLEQIRNGPCYHKANVKIVSVGGGLAYGSLGMSHHATEDLAVMRALPNMRVVAPGDPIEAAAATEALARLDGPGYLRLGRAGEPVVHTAPLAFELGRAAQLREGRDATLISTGGMLATTVASAGALAARGVFCRALSMHTIKPLDLDAVIAAARETRLVVTLEEHSVLGGLGGAVAEVIADLQGAHAPLKRIGLPSTFAPHAGSRDYLAAGFGLSEAAIVASVHEALVAQSPSNTWPPFGLSIRRNTTVA
jgi:transketolase